MQLDETHVAIRVRTLSEIGDLSLLMIRRYPKAFFHAFFAGAAVWILADLLLLGWLPNRFDRQDIFAGEGDTDRWRYVYWMCTLVFLQAPIAGVLTTYTLGQAIFDKQPTLRSAIGEVRRMFWPLLWTLGVRRLVIPAMIFAMLQWGQEADALLDFVIPTGLIFCAALIRSNRPFVPEMILLERCPLRSKNENTITLKRRSKALHSPMSSDLGGRFITVSMTLLVLLACVYFALVWTRGIGLGNWSADRFTMLVFFPLSLWLIASLSVVVRLLGYLDARIRLEGWEVELAIRAEAIRQFGEDSMSVPLNPVRQVHRQTKDKASQPHPDGAAEASDIDPAPAVEPPGTPQQDQTGNPAENIQIESGKGTTTLLWVGWVVGLACGLASSSPVIASPPIRMPIVAVVADTAIVSESVWYDAEAKEVRAIELQDTRVDTENRDSRWLNRPKPPPKPPAAPTPTTSWWGDISFGNIIGWMLLACVVVGLVALLMYVFANSSFDFRPDALSQSVVHSRTLDEQTKQRISELPAELRDTNVNPRSELERLIAAGDFDRAIIYLYGHQLLMLDRAGHLRLSRWKTNKQYVRESKQTDQEIGLQLNQTVDAFEHSYFGRHSLTRERFEDLWQNNLQIENALNMTGGSR
ncbi:hypothetical protein [Rhodopirellula sallentina]|uniref:Signal peptide protein n=1 Tax=Rhodopirellula sallentina SM41 TaxID=1263870 RepID=M5UQE6_9BACT|nr:hypothetical protein [Rhodopirellula sallentina]EMI58193.1 signal peptide protein [Rhodopirellula sallentina SM41]